MAEVFIEEIYKYSKLIDKLRQTVELLRLENTHYSHLLMVDYKKDICDICQECIDAGYPEGKAIWDMVKYVYEDTGDSIVRADMIENAVIPMLEKCVQSMGIINQQLDEKYVIESTSSGFLTLKNVKCNKYLHSNNDPMQEARLQINEYCTERTDSFAVLGCGLGYQVYQLYLFTQGSVRIRLYEKDLNILEYARKYGVLDWIPEDILEIKTDDDVLSFLEDVSDNEVGIYMHLPTILTMEDPVERNAMVTAYGQWHTLFVHKHYFNLNFWRNVHSDAKLFSELDTSGMKKEMVVVAAGPSLDDNMEQLKVWQGQKTIIAVGTVFAKLIKAGIRPDMFVVMDPQKRTMRQIEGVEDENVPLIIDSASYWGFCRTYKGPKYLTFTDETEDVTNYTNKRKIERMPAGGTVTAMALVLAAKLKATSVFMIGVDLSYPGGMSHASGTMDRATANTQGMLQLPGVFGQTVYSTHVFKGYIKWMENFISDFPQITWYNMSSVGARIEGTVEIGGTEVTEALTALPRGKISVIVPCYNVEKYLEECIDSLLKQTMPREMMEFIFVDDASTDSTWSILEKYAKENEDVMRIFHLKENSRQGAARNVGLEFATGNYIGFIDSDDFIDSDMYEILYRAVCNTNADVAICGRNDEVNGEVKGYCGPWTGGVLDMAKEAYANEVINEKVPSGCVQRLYRKSFLDRLKLRFPEKMTYEDNYFIGISNYYLQTVAMVALPLYHYRINPDSTVQKKNSYHHLDRLQIEVMKVEELKRRGAYEYNKDDIEAQFMRLFFANSLTLFVDRFEEIPEGLIFDMQDVVKRYFPNWRENPILQEDKYEWLRKVCELVDYPFQKGDHAELKEVLKEREII